MFPNFNEDGLKLAETKRSFFVEVQNLKHQLLYRENVVHRVITARSKKFQSNSNYLLAGLISKQLISGQRMLCFLTDGQCLVVVTEKDRF